ncbi:hypothetical protein [Rhodanobacter sp. B04]|uniref:hypothetical protein n=1 Tax=Rhodanobacter sp. B04 TaxID=1945860 RepID=UPI00111555A1|nr:hypothetical protein [Rhodanobacter sp. B04]
MNADLVIAYFAESKQSVKWANDAINELHESATAFFKGNVTEIITQVDTQTGENIQKLRLKVPFPDGFSRKTTEALTNIKHAFDQAVFASQSAIGISNSKSNFPWSQNPSDLEHRIRKIDERLRDAISKHEPYSRSDSYSGGNDVIRGLASLANNKHTVGLSVDTRISTSNIPDVSGNVTSLSINHPRWDTEKNEAELIRWKGDANVSRNHRFGFQIIFQDTVLPHPVNIIDGLRAFANKADAVIESLQARCLEIVAASIP